MTDTISTISPVAQGLKRTHDDWVSGRTIMLGDDAMNRAAAKNQRGRRDGTH